MTATMIQSTAVKSHEIPVCKWCGRDERDGVVLEPGVVVGHVCRECDEIEREAQG
jgi:hypothetical protein